MLPSRGVSTEMLPIIRKEIFSFPYSWQSELYRTMVYRPSTVRRASWTLALGIHIFPLILHLPPTPLMDNRSNESRGPKSQETQRVKRFNKRILKKTFRHCPWLRSALTRCGVPLESRLHCECRSFRAFAIFGRFFSKCAPIKRVIHWWPLD